MDDESIFASIFFWMDLFNHQLGYIDTWYTQNHHGFFVEHSLIKTLERFLLQQESELLKE